MSTFEQDLEEIVQDPPLQEWAECRMVDVAVGTIMRGKFNPNASDDVREQFLRMTKVDIMIGLFVDAGLWERTPDGGMKLAKVTDYEDAKARGLAMYERVRKDLAACTLHNHTKVLEEE